MREGSGRRYRRGQITDVVTRIALLEDDVDDNAEDHDRIRKEVAAESKSLRDEIKTFHNDLAGIRAILLGLLISVATGSVLIAVNIALKG